MDTITLAAQALTRRFTQDRYGKDRELSACERQEEIMEQVKNLTKFSYNPSGKRRVRVG